MEDVFSIGIDIGATKANIGLVSESGLVKDFIRLEVVGYKKPEELIKHVSIKVSEIISRNSKILEKSPFIGVGVPGTVDIKTGNVEYCPNLDWEDVPAAELFSQHLRSKVIVAQDSRLAAWAEYLLGAGRGYNSIFCVALGTGIGGGIILDGKIFHGSMNTAGEIGHTIFQKNGRQCNCGRKGCLERYCSGTGIFERALEIKPQLFENYPRKSERVFELAYAGDEDMLKLIHEVVEDLAIGIANAVSIISPEAVIISGGLCEHDALIVTPLRDLVYQFGYHSWARKKSLKIEKALMGSQAPMIGAGLLYKALDK